MIPEGPRPLPTHCHIICISSAPTASGAQLYGRSCISADFSHALRMTPRKIMSRNIVIIAAIVAVVIVAAAVLIVASNQGHGPDGGKEDLQYHTVTFVATPAGYGSVSSGSVMVKDGAQVVISGDRLDVGSASFVAAPSPTMAGYTYSFTGWTGAPENITGDTVIHANFERTQASQAGTSKVSFVVSQGGYGTVSVDSVVADNGTKVLVDGDTLTIGSRTIVATPSSSGSGYVYSFDGWSGVPSAISGDVTIHANFSRTAVPPGESFKVTIVASPSAYGSVSMSSVTVASGTSMHASGSTLRIGDQSISAVPASSTSKYEYGFLGWSGTSSAVTRDMTVIAQFSRTDVTAEELLTVTVIPNVFSYGSVSPSSVKVPAGTSMAISGSTLRIGSSTVVATPSPATSQYSYSFAGWSGAASTVTKDMTVHASFDREAAPCKVTVRYMCDGEAMLKDGTAIEYSVRASYGDKITCSYRDDPRFDDSMAAKYSFKRGYVESPYQPFNQGETVSVTVQQPSTVIVFEFSVNGGYVQLHRQDGPVANPVYQTSEPFGEKHTATIRASSLFDIGNIRVAITDNVTGNHANERFIGAGQTGYYNGHSYHVNQLSRQGPFDAVEVVIDGGLNVHDRDDPLVIWYTFV